MMWTYISLATCVVLFGLWKTERQQSAQLRRERDEARERAYRRYPIQHAFID